MATAEQIGQLRDARGAAADALFLEILAEHHRGGVNMAAYAAENAGSSRVRDLAATMVKNQSVEIDEYAQTAERLGFDVQIDAFDADPFADDG